MKINTGMSMKKVVVLVLTVSIVGVEGGGMLFLSSTSDYRKSNAAVNR